MQLLELLDLEQGFILITGPRGSGKTTITERFRERWSGQSLSYAHLEPMRRGHRLRLRGHRRAIVDEPLELCLEDVESVGLMVLATSVPQPWMFLHAHWVVRLTAGTVVVESGPRAVLVHLPRPTIWERLLSGLDGN